MSQKRNLYYLVDIVSAQTQLDPKVVKIFIDQLFKEIEKGLVVSSVVKIDDLGIFRIIKSISADRVLFLGKFKSDAKSKLVKPQEEEQPIEVIIPVSTIKPSVSEVAYQNEQDEQEPISDYTEDFADINDHVNIHDDTATEYTSIKNQDLDEEFRKRIEEEPYFYDYEKRNEKEKISKNIKIISLFLITIIAVIGILYVLYIYPKQKEVKVLYRPTYTEMENKDTINFSHIIVADSNLDFVSLSKIYFGYEEFWPYIYKANENEISSPLEIPVGAIIKIPRIDQKLIDINNKQSVDSAKMLGNEILKLKSQTNPKRDIIQSEMAATDSVKLKNENTTVPTTTQKKRNTRR